jgi:hypothetical protein
LKASRARCPVRYKGTHKTMSGFFSRKVVDWKWDDAFKVPLINNHHHHQHTLPTKNTISSRTALQKMKEK